ncbi:hypothetical protein [Litoreibacter roseus]|uniref:Lipoprotein n=1 Tax=Litoreibacter roseus TaxID=2601869 RepID=A0A6N6JCB3_9RHOB|nr:hypothetical protein [Litoreibacter roseus]GFE63963.1 hypothetical protein KIN_10370 [Litoreibacter roseus]
MRRIFALLLPVLFISACAEPQKPISIRPGLTQTADLDALRPPSGKTYRFAMEKSDDVLSSELVLKSRRKSAKDYEYKGSVILSIPEVGDLEEVTQQLSTLFKTEGVRAQGSNIFLPITVRTDNRFRTRSSNLLAGPSRFVPHDCFAVIGVCDHVTIIPNGRQVRFSTETTEADGVWRSVTRVTSRDAPAFAKRMREIWTYSIDRNGVVLDLVIRRRVDGKTDTIIFRRKT